jgi:hypothetical protein
MPWKRAGRTLLNFGLVLAFFVMFSAVAKAEEEDDIIGDVVRTALISVKCKQTWPTNISMCQNCCDTDCGAIFAATALKACTEACYLSCQ